jgi:hypothetical protein
MQMQDPVTSLRNAEVAALHKDPSNAMFDSRRTLSLTLLLILASTSFAIKPNGTSRGYAKLRKLNVTCSGLVICSFISNGLRRYN